jgi:MDMPI C-terminal domain
VHTTNPIRAFTFDLTEDAVTFASADARRDANVTLPAEALIRLLYGRLDPAHTPTVTGDAGVLNELRRVFPGP